MTDIRKTLTAEQSEIVAAFAQTYGIEPEDILFFSEKPEPFFTYEATCILCNELTDLEDIDLQPISSVSGDSLTIKCNLTNASGRTRGAVGIANLNEKIDGQKMSDQQLFQLASARAIRNALRTAGIDLLKLHRQEMSEGELDFRPKTNYATLIARAHLLGKEALLINGENKDAWYRQLWNRYEVNNSNNLSEEQLADFVAFLNTLVPNETVREVRAVASASGSANLK